MEWSERKRASSLRINNNCLIDSVRCLNNDALVLSTHKIYIVQTFQLQRTIAIAALLSYFPRTQKFNECKNWLFAKAMLTEWEKWLKFIQNLSRGHLPLITQMNATVLNVNNLLFRFFWLIAFNPFCLPQFTEFLAMLLFFCSVWFCLSILPFNCFVLQIIVLSKMELNRFNAVSSEPCA